MARNTISLRWPLRTARFDRRRPCSTYSSVLRQQSVFHLLPDAEHIRVTNCLTFNQSMTIILRAENFRTWSTIFTFGIRW